MQESHELFDERSFFPRFYQDLDNTKHLLLVQSPFVAVRQIDKLGSRLKSCCSRGVRLCVFVQEPPDWRTEKNSPRMKPFIGAVELLQEYGAHVTVRRKIHEKIVVIDDSILWDGSLNVLSHYDTSERMMRWHSTAKVQVAITKHKLNSCGVCSRTAVHELFAPTLSTETFQEYLGKQISEARRASGMTATELARQSQVQRKVIYELERGTRNCELQTLLKISQILGLSAALIPKHYVPAVGDRFRAEHMGTSL